MARRNLFNSERVYLSVTAAKPLDRETVAAIKAEADARGISTQALVLEICRAYLECIRGLGHA